MNEKKRKNLGKRVITLIVSAMMIYGYITFLYGRWTGAVLVLIAGVVYLSLGLYSWTSGGSEKEGVR